MGACGGGGGGVGDTTYSGADVQRAFSGVGLAVHPVPSRGAEQPAMGETSPCATQYAATTARGTIQVSVCERTADVQDAAGYDRTRGNVGVAYSGHDAATQHRVARALAALG